MQGNLESSTVTVSEVTNAESDSNGDYDHDVLHSEMAHSLVATGHRSKIGQIFIRWQKTKRKIWPHSKRVFTHEQAKLKVYEKSIAT